MVGKGEGKERRERGGACICHLRCAILMLKKEENFMMAASGTRYIYNSSLSCCIQVITFL